MCIEPIQPQRLGLLGTRRFPLCGGPSWTYLSTNHPPAPPRNFSLVAVWRIGRQGSLTRRATASGSSASLTNPSTKRRTLEDSSQTRWLTSLQSLYWSSWRLPWRKSFPRTTSRSSSTYPWSYTTTKPRPSALTTWGGGRMWQSVCECWIGSSTSYPPIFLPGTLPIRTVFRGLVAHRWARSSTTDRSPN